MNRTPIVGLKKFRFDDRKVRFFRMREDRRRRYDDGFRREALELIKSGAGGNTLARRLAIPVYTARNWIRLYRSNGEEAAAVKAKVAYLEKLRALRASKSRGASEAPSSDCSQGGDTGSATS